MLTAQGLLGSDRVFEFGGFLGPSCKGHSFLKGFLFGSLGV